MSPHLSSPRVDRRRLDHAPPRLDRRRRWPGRRHRSLAPAPGEAGGSPRSGRRLSARPDGRAFVLFVWLYRPDPAMGLSLAPAGRMTKPDGRATDDLATLPALRPSHPDAAPLTAEPPNRLASRFEPLVAYLPGVWLAGSIATLAMLATGLVGVERLRRSSRPLEADAIAGDAAPWPIPSASPAASAWRSATGLARPCSSASCGP